MDEKGSVPPIKVIPVKTGEPGKLGGCGWLRFTRELLRLLLVSYVGGLAWLCVESYEESSVDRIYRVYGVQVRGYKELCEVARVTVWNCFISSSALALALAHHHHSGRLGLGRRRLSSSGFWNCFLSSSASMGQNCSPIFPTQRKCRTMIWFLFRSWLTS